MKRVKRPLKLNPGTLTPEQMEYGKRIGEKRQKHSRNDDREDKTFKKGHSAPADEIGGQAEVFEQMMCKKEAGLDFDIAEVDEFHARADVGGLDTRYNGDINLGMILKYVDRSNIPHISLAGNPKPPDFVEVGWIDPGQIREIYNTLMEVLRFYPDAQEALREFLKPNMLQEHEEFMVPRNWLNYMDTLNRNFKKK